MSLGPTDRPQRASSTAVSIASRFASQPTTARRGVPSGDGATAIAHLEHADFVGRAKAVFDRAQDAELVAALAFEIEHGIDHVFEHARAGDQPLFCDVSD